MQKLSVVDVSCAFFNQPKMHTLQLHAVMSHVSFQDPQLLRAARHARRLRFLLPWVQHCWTWPWATLNLKDLEEFAERWAKLSESTLPWLETKVMLEELLFRGVSRNKNQNEAQKWCWFCGEICLRKIHVVSNALVLSGYTPGSGDPSKSSNFGTPPAY